MRLAQELRWLSGGLRFDLVTLSVLYLAAPLGLFFYGYLRPAVGLPLLLVLILCLVQMLQEASPAAPGQPRLGWRTVAVTLAIALAWVALSGIGGVGVRRWDFIKHDAVLKTLIDFRWPVVWTDPPHAFVYYFAWYLPAAVVGKVLGWAAAQCALLIWSVAGVLLTLLWVQRLGGRASWTLPMLFVFLGGLDLAGFMLFRGDLPEPHQIEWWSATPLAAGGFRGQYSGSTSLLFTVPNQAIGGWLATAVVLQAICTRSGGSSLPACFVALCFWSPFAAVGLVPFALYAALRLQVDDWTLVTNSVLCMGTLTVLGFFYSARSFPGDGGMVPDLPRHVLAIAIFLSVEIGALTACVAAGIRKRSLPEKHVFAVALAFLVACPFFQYGGFNDWVMRASIPALFALWLSFLRTFESRTLRMFACAVWVAGAAAATLEIVLSGRAFAIALPDRAQVAYVYDMKIDRWVVEQYLADRDAAFFRWFAPVARGSMR